MRKLQVLFFLGVTVVALLAVALAAGAPYVMP